MKKRKKSKRSVKANRPQRRSPKGRSAKEIRRLLLIAVISLSFVGVGLAAFKRNYEVTHDLSVIGKGVPVVVQIHDPGCSKCAQLRRNASAAAEHFDNRLLFRIADISTPVGRAFQRRHGVPHVTLLLFDGKGVKQRELNGVISEELLLRSFEAHLGGG